MAPPSLLLPIPENLGVMQEPPTPTFFYLPQLVNHRQVYSTSVNPQIHPLVFITTVTTLIHHRLKVLQKISKQLSSSPRYSLFRNKTNLYKMPIRSCSWLIPSISLHCPQNQVQLFFFFFFKSNSLSWFTRLTSVSLTPTSPDFPLRISCSNHIGLSLFIKYVMFYFNSWPSNTFYHFTHTSTHYDVTFIHLAALSINNIPKEGLLSLKQSKS